jgi:hypothetical protein
VSRWLCCESVSDTSGSLPWVGFLRFLIIVFLSCWESCFVLGILGGIVGIFDLQNGLRLVFWLTIGTLGVRLSRGGGRTGGRRSKNFEEWGSGGAASAGSGFYFEALTDGLDIFILELQHLLEGVQDLPILVVEWILALQGS